MDMFPVKIQVDLDVLIQYFELHIMLVYLARSYANVIVN
jgi:hypothetical protein